ncbi:ribonuclease H2 subunit B [Episyrphus balteatus]|uniref:ribonuclease H2 subunit B n=1 Tax=Episyrphus balteatus TaxID=286459 RepID=UPI0024861B52|nr:ribonuclease H2 subunit B [Episyrphus balteatus]
MTTRSKSTKKSEEISSAKKLKKLDAKQKVFFFEKDLLKDSENLKFEFFHHPGKGKRALFIVDIKTKKLFEIQQFSEPHRSWLINNKVCSNGKAYLTIPIDSTFLALFYLKKFCSERAMALDDIIDDDDPSVHKFLSQYVIKDHLEIVADVKTASGMNYFKYNPQRTIAWMAVKVKNLAERLKKESIYCGFSSLSQNYKKSEVTQTVEEVDYLRNACDIVGSYVDLNVHEELKEYLGIKEMEIKAANNKRKSINSENGLAKKIKLEDSSSENNIEESPKAAAPVKEKKVTAKDKALAKGAKGTKSISSFFKK